MDATHDATLPPWQVMQWFNTPRPLEPADLAGRVVLVHAFQMLCPGCVAHGLPLAARVHERYGRDEVLVIGLHTVFEHHDAMGPNALAAFIHEYRLRFPIGIDAPSPDGPVPRTMARWNLRGTPSTLLIDRAGTPRLKHFGAIDELELGVMIGRLLADGSGTRRIDAASADAARGCAEGACPAPA